MVTRTHLTSPSLLMVVALCGVFLAALDQTVVVTALPSIMQDIHLPVTKLEKAMWIITGYLLGYTFAMPLMACLSDVYGRVRVYVMAMLLFIGGSVLVAIGESLSWLIGARVIQAIGGGATLPVTMAIAADIFPDRRRAVALGVIGAVAEAGGVLGPLYGGLLINFAGWRWIFWVNLPLGLLIAVLLAGLMPATPRLRVPVDYIGGLLIAGCLALLTFGLWQEVGNIRPLWQTVGFVAASLALLAAFILRERWTSHPLLELSLFRRLAFAAANGTHLLVGGALIIAMVNVPLMTDTVLGQPPLEGGLRLMRLSGAIPFGAVAGGFLCGRFGYRLPMFLGLGLVSLGFYWLSSWGLGIADPAMTVHLATTGFGFGLVIAPIAAAVIDQVGEARRGVASAVVTLSRMIGMMVGLSVLTSWGMGRYAAVTSAIPFPFPQTGDTAAQTQQRLILYQEQVTKATLGLFNNLFLAAAVVAAMALLPAMLMYRRR
ncbi:MAG: MFS transporter [Dehalococcoidia bacterium]|nr:MFS transporter [Dehalococcoidia bacterium]